VAHDVYLMMNDDNSVALQTKSVGFPIYCVYFDAAS
jgi:hypothetical protein